MRQKYFLPISRLRNAANKCNDWGSWQGLDSGLLAVAKDLFNIPEGMLQFGTNSDFDFLGFQFFGIQLLPGA